ncbi:DUF6603 domain-containing protein [Ulvibacterium marinum]|uniref:DUF6603 domain-containing protein n=1 Tax=Ulvibacterium marinum TaxID=2419782 RepID=UPI0024947CEB|nr:DUF6603 domain-containing protein [Ulvibacterium marinum]
MSDIAIISWAVKLAKVIGDGSAIFDDFSLEQLGLQLPIQVIDNSNVQGAITNLKIASEELQNASTSLQNASTSGSETELILAFVAFGVALSRFIVDIKTLIDNLENSINTSTIPNTGERTIALELVGKLLKKLLDVFIIAGIEDSVPKLMVVLKILGLVDWDLKQPDPSNSLSIGFVNKELHFERIKDIFNDPGKHFEDTTGWGTNGFDPSEFFEIYRQFFDEEDQIDIGLDGGDPFLRKGILKITKDSSQTPPGLTAELIAEIEDDQNIRTNLGSDWGFGLSTDIKMSGSIGVTVTPPLSFNIAPPAGEILGALRLFLDRNLDARPFDIIGGNGLLTLSADNITGGVGLLAQWDVINSSASANPILFSEISGGKIKIGSEGSDSFLATLLSSVDLEGNFDLGLDWSPLEGLKIRASGGIEIMLPMHINLGVLEFINLFIGLKIDDDSSFVLETSTGIKANFGVLSATVEQMGAETNLAFAEDGKFGFFDLSIGFKPPNGVGLSVDAGVVKGGGYLFFDFDNEEYAGALELTFAEFLSLKAIGLITTKMPDGSDGFSMIIIITAEFTIQLGFGFVFLGAGGLLGLHRTMKLEPLAEGVRTGATSGILFPTNVVENAPKIISDLKVFFPVEEGKFLIGPMVKLGWGTPTLISISLGIIIEIRVNNGGGIERIAILGVLKCILPDEEAALLVLQVSFIGAIDFQKKNAFFFASIFESRVLFITIEGEMGVLVAWGDDSNFVVSVGGFHPRFNPPPLPFPVPKRVALNILNESWGKIRVEGYFAVTTNTVQLGCKLELYFGFSEFKIEGHLAFDALFQFDPFYFIIEISGKVSLKVFGFDLFTISLKFSLEGTSPWRATGYGKLKILFFSFKAKFDKTWGDSKNTKLPPISIIPLLEAELQNIQNWQALEPASTSGLLVSLREVPDSDDSIALHPVGTLRVSQRALPLKIHLDKFGSKKPDDANKLEVEVSGPLQKISDIKESFARAQFQDMKDSKKLSSPAYEKEDGGLELSVTGDQTRFGKITVRHVRYELITIDTAYKRRRRRFFNWSQRLFVHFFANSAVRRVSVSHRVKKEFQPFDEKIDVRAGTYTVAFNKDNKPFNKDATNFESMARADEFINELISDDPHMADAVHTIPNNEVNLVQ